MSSGAGHFKIDVEGQVIVWRFHNPPSNLWNLELSEEFNTLVDDFYRNPGLRVAIFTSALPDVFIRHFDVSQLEKIGEELAKPGPAENPPTPRQPWPIKFQCGSKPIIAAINASLAGGGLELAMSFDFRFMSRGATAAQPEIVLGILPGGGGTQKMPRLIGLPRALELMLTGRPIFADEAERIGLITRACDPARLMPEALAFAREMAAMPPLAVHHIRQCVYEGVEMNIEDGLALESQLMSELMKSDEARLRMSAYVASGQSASRTSEERDS